MDSTTPTLETELTATNGNEQVLLPDCDKETLTLVLLILIICLAGLAGNAVVLWLLGFRMRRNAFSVYVLHLAAADFLFLCFQVVDYLEKLIDFLHSTSVYIPDFFTIVSTFAYLAGLSMITGISTERCLSVLKPIWYRYHRPRHTSTVMCALLWALSLLLSILEGKYCGFLFRNGDYGWCQTFDFITAGWLIFLFLVLSGSSLTLLLRIFCGSRWMQLTRLYVTIMLTVLVFLLCGLPFGIHWFLLIWIQNYFYLFPCHLYTVSVVLSCVNSCANPIIYFLVGSFRQQWWRRRQTLKVTLQRALEDIPEIDDSEGSLPQASMEMSGSSVV
ncbi:PREDICTED: mas-related G-protein coupled receptor member X2-like [Galeopterus variegatus]|uniref:Mas-related G-protein coupled receptor member X2-like n=1 Tax=Galeopterus variegatus TaxID=482537 RepID=A0ABM0RDI8_GALVR|nr:PREDICTED: mas-related G-protein coupled receptor member X2-like [Galeopterus variegatus]